jgi:hypothetical protein
MSEKDPYGNKKKNENPENQAVSDPNWRDIQGNRDNTRGDNIGGVSSTTTQTQDMNDRTLNMQGTKKTNTDSMEQDEQEVEA